MATHVLAVILRNPSNHAEFLLLKQTPPPKFGQHAYDSYVDSDLWDLPSTLLNLHDNHSNSGIFIQAAQSFSQNIDLTKFDVQLGLNRVLEQLGFKVSDVGEWSLFKYVEEPEFGPGFPVNTVFVMGKLLDGNQICHGLCKWMSIESCLNWLLEVKPYIDRVGPLVAVALINDSLQSAARKLPPTLRYQEYPPGVVLVPMRSRTAKPFHTTNLVIFAPENVSDTSGDCSFVSCGDALIVDPGCRVEYHEELKQIVACLPKKLIVFVTHHHRDHVEASTAPALASSRIKQAEDAPATSSGTLLNYQQQLTLLHCTSVCLQHVLHSPDSTVQNREAETETDQSSQKLKYKQVQKK